MATEIFKLAKYVLGDEGGDYQMQFALVDNARPFVLRICKKFKSGHISPLYGLGSANNRFEEKYQAAINADNDKIKHKLAPKVAIGFSAFLLAKASWNPKHSRWDGLSIDCLEKYAEEYNSIAKDPYDTIEEHYALERKLWCGSIKLWNKSKLADFDKDVIELYKKVSCFVDSYLKGLSGCSYSVKDNIPEITPGMADITDLQLLLDDNHTHLAEELVCKLGDLTGVEAAEIVVNYIPYFKKENEIYFKRFYDAMTRIKPLTWVNTKSKHGNWNKAIKAQLDKKGKREEVKAKAKLIKPNR